ncbi:MogA/MoaB family molybdenum cofactor biosynthesis protein [Jeotgalibacillus sp. S-D1]|uniref:MogA/MoaB family molybdenum cofactor biosynthesis protein n=1 Tax=Jeotgalibacillus sp. S-D1 TaxID=2552189 RepID=UPI00105A1FF1|nr:MogA/MoaB family molybdenum cofactor biosynthesis protein [Jeotgalibacillus sp. S-D1]TDL31408.1 MogA/MoaB family molybdenum cofactor biosynthesis protein [Jeotgalibacillus sp. S-D1]
MLEDHRKKSAHTVRCKVLTVSDTRNEDTDKSGKLIKDLLTGEGHVVEHYEIVPDENLIIKRAVQSGLQDPDIDAVLINGGTGFSKRDVTIEAVQTLFEKEIVGFGELFRYLSFTEDIGSAAILSRAAAGTAGETVIFAMPGSTGAVKLAMRKLILPEIGHIVSEINK